MAHGKDRLWTAPVYIYFFLSAQSHHFLLRTTQHVSIWGKVLNGTYKSLHPHVIPLQGSPDRCVSALRRSTAPSTPYKTTVTAQCGGRVIVLRVKMTLKTDPGLVLRRIKL